MASMIYTSIELMYGHGQVETVGCVKNYIWGHFKEMVKLVKTPAQTNGWSKSYSPKTAQKGAISSFPQFPPSFIFYR